MLLPLKVLAPAGAIEHMPGWSMVSVSIGKEKERDDGTSDNYGICVAILVNPELSEALTGNAVNDPEAIARQVLVAAQRALEGFLGTPPAHKCGEQ